VVYLSTIDPAKAVYSRSQRVEKIRAFERPYRHASFVDTLPAGGGYYVEMENFRAKVGHDKVAALDAKGKPVLYFNKGDIDKVKKHKEWISVEDGLSEQLKVYKKEHKNAALAAAFIDLRAGSSFGYINRMEARLMELTALLGEACPKRGPWAKFATLYRTAKPDLTDRDMKMRKLCEIKSEKQLAMLRGLVEEIKQQYPELMLLLTNTHQVASAMVPVYKKLIG
jgi:hypothetical protein